MFTKDTEYAIIIVRELKTNANNESPVKLHTIVEKNNIKQGFAEQVCRKLKNNEIIQAVKGPGGGYFLTTKGKEANLWDLMWAVETRLKNKIEKLLPESKDIFFNCEDKLKEVYIGTIPEDSEVVQELP